MECKFMQGVEFSHWLFKRFLPNNANVIDATAGRGKDTEFLAQLLEKKGKIWAFDIQEKAIQITYNNLKNKDLLFSGIQLINDGHENIANYVNTRIEGAIFNLGYLPGENKEIITEPETTLKALHSCLKLLEQGGIIVIVIYTGHEGGKKEQKELIKYTGTLSSHKYNVLHYHFINQEKPPAEVVAIRKRRKGD